MRDFLFEIGTEELPASFINPAGEQFLSLVLKTLDENRIDHGEAKWFGTPRRLAVLVKEVAEKQAVTERNRIGPPKKAAFDKDGNPTQALLGFAKSLNVDPSTYKIVVLEKGEYVAFTVKEGGRDTVEILREKLPQIVASIKFPKTMRWLDDFRFARPIRWIVALFGSEVIEVEIAGLKSTRYTRGHRLLANKDIPIEDASEYEKVLEKAYVIPDFKKRREIVKKLIEEEASRVGGRILQDDELIDEVANLVEYPQALIGSFSEEFLSLPKPVVVTAMKQHQRYFSVVDENGELLPYFVAVINNLSEHREQIVPGLERVLKARLEDARFYYEEDMKKKLRDRKKELKGIVWKAGLGSVYDKVLRIKNLALKLSENDPSVDRKLIEEAAELLKTDLTTEMIKDGKEFTKLEGVIGREYALRQGEDPRIADILFEHLLPRYPGDKLPKLREAAYIGIADRLDTIAGLLSTGYEPKGSEDPMGLRRLAYAVIDLLLNLNIRIDLEEALQFAAQPFKHPEEVVRKGLNFLLSRFENYLEERDGVRYDFVDAVIASRVKDIVNLRKRALALKELREREPEVFEKVVIGQKRVANILKETELGEPDPELFEKDEERKLYQVAREKEPIVRKAVDDEKFNEALRALLDLREPIDKFFDNVFVMVEDNKLRNNRLSLLSFTRRIFRYYGDFSKIVVESSAA